MGESCGWHEFFSLGGQDYSLGYPTLHQVTWRRWLCDPSVSQATADPRHHVMCHVVAEQWYGILLIFCFVLWDTRHKLGGLLDIFILQTKEIVSLHQVALRRQLCDASVIQATVDPCHHVVCRKWWLSSDMAFCWYFASFCGTPVTSLEVLSTFFSRCY